MRGFQRRGILSRFRNNFRNDQHLRRHCDTRYIVIPKVDTLLIEVDRTFNLLDEEAFGVGRALSFLPKCTNLAAALLFFLGPGEPRAKVLRSKTASRIEISNRFGCVIRRGVGAREPVPHCCVIPICKRFMDHVEVVPMTGTPSKIVAL